mmetsp:Transcript_27105/g.44215  ORF Transcript_27105/g.44215 Transcript_27105/m.44215 type:complete len:270 (+) Transcript_27105:467-1276(+)
MGMRVTGNDELGAEPPFMVDVPEPAPPPPMPLPDGARESLFTNMAGSSAVIGDAIGEGDADADGEGEGDSMFAATAAGRLEAFGSPVSPPLSISPSSSAITSSLTGAWGIGNGVGAWTEAGEGAGADTGTAGETGLGREASAAGGGGGVVLAFFFFCCCCGGCCEGSGNGTDTGTGACGASLTLSFTVTSCVLGWPSEDSLDMDSMELAASSKSGLCSRACRKSARASSRLRRDRYAAPLRIKALTFWGLIFSDSVQSAIASPNRANRR